MAEEAQCLISLGEWSHVFAYSFIVLHLTLSEVHFHILQSTLHRRHMSDIRSKRRQYTIPTVAVQVLLGMGLDMFHKGKGLYGSLPDPLLYDEAFT